MRIDEAIECERENARLLKNNTDLALNAEYHTQVANWLEDLLNSPKKEPKVTVSTYYKTVRDYWHKCPECDFGLCWGHNVHPNYCSNCGQKLIFIER